MDAGLAVLVKNHNLTLEGDHVACVNQSDLQQIIECEPDITLDLHQGVGLSSNLFPRKGVTKQEACQGLLKAIEYLQAYHSSTKSHIKTLFTILSFIQEQSIPTDDIKELQSNRCSTECVLQDDSLSVDILDIQCIVHTTEDDMASNEEQQQVVSTCDKHVAGIEERQLIDDIPNTNNTSQTDISEDSKQSQKSQTKAGKMNTDTIMMNKDNQHRILTLPKCLMLKMSSLSNNGCLGVFTQVSIKRDTCFGPCPKYVIKNVMAKDSTKFRIQRESIDVDNDNDDTHSALKWMTLIQQTEDSSIQNIQLVKHKRSFYYQVTQDLPPNTELVISKQQVNPETSQHNHQGRLYAGFRPQRKETGLKSHKPKSEPINKSHKCDQCGKSFKSHSTLYYHKRLHSGEKNFQCSICSKLFTARAGLNSHLLTHSDKKPYTCSECGKCFAQLGNLQSHRRIHTGEKPFICSVCGQRFAHKSTIQAHMCRHTGERKYQCPVCGKRYYRSDVLAIHISTHSSEKNHKCDICGKAFSNPSYVHVHKKMHSSEKAYLCVQCGERFTRAQSLKRHIDCIHLKLGGKHACVDCGKEFKRHYHLKRHVQSTHSRVDGTKLTVDQT